MKTVLAMVSFCMVAVSSNVRAANELKGAKSIQCEFVKEVIYRDKKTGEDRVMKVDAIRLKALGNRKVCTGWAKCVVNGITRFSQVACSSGLNEDCKNATQCYQEEGSIEASAYEGSKAPYQGTPSGQPVSTGSAN